MTEYNKEDIRKYIEELYSLRWTQEDMQKLSREYTSNLVHLALERADMKKDEDAFRHILKKNARVLTRHIELSEPVLGTFYFHHLTSLPL